MNADHTPAFVPIRLLEMTGGDTELFNELFAEFQGNLKKYADELNAAADRTSWKTIAHRLKGAAQAVGAESIASIAILAELSAPGDQDLLVQLNNEIRRFGAL